MEETSVFQNSESDNTYFSYNNEEESGYISNLSSRSGSYKHFSPTNFSSSYSRNRFDSFNLNTTEDSGDSHCLPISDGVLSSSLINSSYDEKTEHVSSAKRENESLSEELEINFAKKLRTDIEFRIHSNFKSDSKEVQVPGSAECRIFNSTPYSDFINKLKSTVSSTYKKSLVGRTYVDFLYFLGIKENHSPVLQKIFSYLPHCDLYRASRVSKTWYYVLMNNPVACKRITDFRNKSYKENGIPHLSQKPLDSVESTGPIANRVKLMEIQNKTSSSNLSSHTKHTPLSKSPPVSPSKIRFYLFQKEGQKLDPGERLVQCPRCFLPSRQVKAENLGTCTRQGCQFQFCLSCYCEFNEPHQCSFLTPRNWNKSSSTIGTKLSKRRLRRL